MAKLEQSKAGKDYPEHGIKKGDTYWWSQEFRGPKRFFKAKPRPSQYASGDFFPTFYAIGEEIEDLQQPKGTPLSLEDISGLVEDWKSRLEELQNETQEKFDNLPEQFQEADNGQRLQGRVDACEAWISALDKVDLETPEEGTDMEEHLDTVIQNLVDTVQECE